MKKYADYIDATDMRQQIERLTAELAAAKAKHYEECAVICEAIANNMSMAGESINGCSYLASNCAKRIRRAAANGGEVK